MSRINRTVRHLLIIALEILNIIKSVQPTIEILTICENIPNNFHLPHSDDHQKYYLCENGFPVARDCPGRLVFNSRSGFCDLPGNFSSVHRKISNENYKFCDNLPNGYTKKDPLSCFKYFQCVNGNFKKKECPENFYFNEKSGFCDKAEHVKCATSKKLLKPDKCFNISKNFTISHEINRNFYYECDGAGRSMLRKCQKNLIFNHKTGFCDLDFMYEYENKPPENCHFNVVHDQSINDPSSCENFFHCVFGELIPKKCYDGLWFDPKREECVLPEKLQCSLSMKKLCENIPDQFNVDDPSGDKRNYVRCGRDFSERKTCEIGKWFNRRTGFCDKVLNIEIDDRERIFIDNLVIDLIKPTSSLNPTEISTILLPVPVPLATTTQKPIEITSNTDFHTICDDSPNDLIIKYPNTCDQYIMCQHGEAHNMTCPTGLQFNPITKVCDYSENVDCKISVRTPKSRNFNDDSKNICASFPHGTYLKNPRACDKYFYCRNNQMIEMTCPDGFNFNPSMAGCDWKENFDCARNEIVINERFCRSGRILKDDKCPDGLWFDATQNVCDFPKENDC